MATISNNIISSICQNVPSNKIFFDAHYWLRLQKVPSEMAASMLLIPMALIGAYLGRGLGPLCAPLFTSEHSTVSEKEEVNQITTVATTILGVCAASAIIISSVEESEKAFCS